MPRSPASVSMGSPGTMRIRKNASSVIPKKVGMIRLSRVKIKRSIIAGHQKRHERGLRKIRCGGNTQGSRKSSRCRLLNASTLEYCSDFLAPGDSAENVDLSNKPVSYWEFRWPRATG